MFEMTHLYFYLIPKFTPGTINPLSCGAPYLSEDNRLESCSGTTPMYLRSDQTLVPLCSFENTSLIYHYLSMVTPSSWIYCRPCSQGGIMYINGQAGVSGWFVALLYAFRKKLFVFYDVFPVYELFTLPRPCICPNSLAY
jgi:hypothetical protein